jgi:His-Xaa-Ser repeat protein HxsA
MNNKLRDLVKKVILGATAALSTHSLTASSKPSDFKIPDQNKQTEFTLTNLDKESKLPLLVLQKPSSQITESSFFHESHSSHASHASHESHASHASGYTEPTYTPPPTENIPKPVETKKPVEENNTTKSTNEMVFKLGSRILEKDMTGTDVAELQDLLVNKGYKIKVTATFDEVTEKALKAFQKKKKVDVTGKLDALTLYYLQIKK